VSPDRSRGDGLFTVVDTIDLLGRSAVGHPVLAEVVDGPDRRCADHDPRPRLVVGLVADSSNRLAGREQW
jgi:hypothetical protein